MSSSNVATVSGLAATVTIQGTADPDLTHILIINPMPSTNKANAKVEATITKYLQEGERAVEVDVLRIGVDVPTIAGDETETASYSVDSDAYKQKMELLKKGHYHGVHILGASCDHIPFENTKNREIIGNLINAATTNKVGIFATCNGAFEVLNHVYKVKKGINEHRNYSKNPSGPKYFKIIGHFVNAVSKTVSCNPVTEAFKAALRQAPVLPTGRVGFMVDEDMHKLAEDGVLEILATSPDMTGRKDAQIAAVYDDERNILCVAPHIEYGPSAIQGEVDRDHENPQGRTETPPRASITNLNPGTTKEGKALWRNAGIALYAAWIDSINTPGQSANLPEAANDDGLKHGTGVASRQIRTAKL